MLRDLIRLLKALISDIRADYSKIDYFYIDDTPKTIGTKIKRR